MIYNLYKQRGETPLECVQGFAKATPELKGEKMTYMGRLDPLAEGVLLMASGEDVKRKEEFLGLDKEYDFVSIFGFATDTYDVLGKILRVEKLNEIAENDIRKVAIIYEGEREQKYPEYSSKMMSKQKLLVSKYKREKQFPREQLSDRDRRESEGIFQQKNTPVAREDVAFPDEKIYKKINIYRVQFHRLDMLNNKELFGRLLMDISKVNGDFRQHEILALWKQYLFNGVNANYFLGKFSAHVSSGTYIRSLVNDMGNTLGFGATTLSIRRTRVGDYKIENSIKY